MCAKAPTPQAPPAPIPERESDIDSRRNRQQAARASTIDGGINSTMLSQSSAPANVATPQLSGKLGG